MQITRIISLASVLTITLTTSSCGIFSRNTPLQAENKTLSASTRRNQALAMQTWQVDGSIGITANNKTDTGTFTWEQDGSRYDFKTYGPLNMAGIRIQGDPKGVTLWKNANHRVYARTPEQLMAKELGWYLPLSNLHYWARGMSAPGSTGQAKYDPYGHILRLNQQGWLIEYRRYQGVKGMDLPQLMVLQNKNLRAKIAFKRWRVSTS